MKKIVGYLREYITSLNKNAFLFSTLFTALLVYGNYHFGLNKYIGKLHGLWPYLAWYTLFLCAFGVAYWLQKIFEGATVFHHRKFIALLVVAPAIFAWKMVYSLRLSFATDIFENEYWNAVVYWPFKVVVIAGVLWLLHCFFNRGEPFYGLKVKGFSPKPYAVMLLMMVPLIAVASTQKDFRRMYPRMQNIEFLLQPGTGLYKLLYELSYGTDFFTIELFFRGFLVLGFAKWAGKGAVLPMAIFYCTIHFGKPLGECISSYFGGIILGIVSYHTRTIVGGFMVHVGIAWLMELGGSVPLTP